MKKRVWMNNGTEQTFLTKRKDPNRFSLNASSNRESLLPDIKSDSIVIARTWTLLKIQHIQQV